MNASKHSMLNQHRKQLYNLILFALLAFSLGRVDALINVPVSQKSSLNQFIEQDIHSYFDISYQGQSGLIQADDNATYMFSKISERSENIYQFVSIPHSTQAPTTVYNPITMNGYHVFGMCQFNGSLDYVVGLDIASNELRVIRFAFTMASTGNSAVIQDYKVVDKDNMYKILVGTVYVDCAYDTTFKGYNSYVIGIGGTYFHSNQISSYYLSKFSTKYNFTEYIILSENPEIMEAARGVLVDFDNNMIYLSVEINKNKYFGRTVYTPGDNPGVDNSNIAIHGYSWTHGVRIWTTVLGNVNFTDQFSRMKHWGNQLYVFLNSFSTQYSTISNTDIYYYRIWAFNGVIKQSQIFGSPQNDKIMDLQITFNGLYLLAYINDQFLPHMSNAKIWQTQNSVPNVVLIWMGFNDEILDIEGYDLATLPFTNYPEKLFVPRLGGPASTTLSFVFVSPRSNDAVDQNGGYFVTYFANSQALFYLSMGCDSNCARCSSQDVTKCIQCIQTTTVLQQVYQHKCYPVYQAPIFTFNAYDDNNNMLLYVKDCHYSCKNCTGPHEDQCTSCCQDNACTSILNRVPNLGKCLCPTGLIDANGNCGSKCVLGLAGKRGNLCLPQCPADSLPFMNHAQFTQAQERTQYDPPDCSQSNYHLKFTSGNSGEGKGLAIEGPPNLVSMPREFTMAFWVFPSLLQSQSYFLNAFNRVYVKCSSSNSFVNFQFQNGPLPANMVEPVYVPLRQSVSMNDWNFISISFRTYLASTIEKYEQIIAISNSNVGIVYQAGYDNTQLATTYSQFTNTIYLGAYNDVNPQSFSGYMKEFKMFTAFHGFKQMQDEQLRLYRYYSYDDHNLVAYWKLSENYLPTDISYTIQDYSINQNKITYSKISKPLYPQFVFDYSIALALCIFHDVSICLSLDYTDSHPYVVTQKRVVQAPTFNIKDLTYVKTDFDQIWFVPNNTQCLRENIQASIQFKAVPVYQWFLNDANFNPSINLTNGEHYQVCYFIAQMNVVFNLYQIYLISTPTTIDPSTNDAFMSSGVFRVWGSTGGDQGYMDLIKFSLDCDHTINNDYNMLRDSSPSYGQHYTSDFAASGDYYFCWMPTFIQETNMPYFNTVHDLKFRIVSVPTVDTSAIVDATTNENMVRYNLQGAFVEGDQIKVSWKGNIISDCNPMNFIGDTFVRNFSYWPSMWFGYQTGVFGIKNNSMDELHICYFSAANNAPQAWSRIKKTTGTSYFVRVKKYSDPWSEKCPELVGFTPLYGSTELYDSDIQIKFWFNNEAVFPSRSSDSPIAFGSIIIYRGGLRPDGTIVQTGEILWSNTNLNDIGQVNPLSQGDLQCSGTGQCSITLSSSSSRMKGGEIYFLSFFKNSFSYKLTQADLVRYYLFNTLLLQVGQVSAYDHMFFCRSFNVTYAEKTINGQSFSMQGLDLQYKLIRAVLDEGTSVQALFQTKAINLHMSVANTQNTYCVSNSPIATVDMENVFQTNFSVSNLELYQCNEGVLMADVELVRGFMDSYGVFTHVRSEWHKNIKIGDIMCDKTCKFCNGTTNQDCVICQANLPYLANGQCYNQCPPWAPYFMKNSLIYQQQKWSAPYCLPQCPLGNYPDSLTNECLACNQDCQTCNTRQIKSCITCNPVRYLYFGLCVDECPQPHYQNNFTTYMCKAVSQTQFLKVQIQSLGFKLKIPKDKQTFLRAIINNDGGGQITSILWQQLTPIATDLNMLVFSVSPSGAIDNKTAVVRLKMTALNYISSNQVVKVQCTVTNSAGEIAYDIYEFFQNSPPDQLALGASTILNITGALSLGNGTTGDSLYVINATNWYDADIVYFKIYMLKNNIMVTLSDQVQQLMPQSIPTYLYFQIPLLTGDLSVLQQNVSICLLAGDSEFATSVDCIVLSNLTNNVQYKANLNLLQNQLLNLTYTKNLTNAVYAAQMMFYAMQTPNRTQSSPGICTLDYHCSSQGSCQSFSGNQRCLCDQGYFGSFCQFQGQQFTKFVQINTNIINALYNKMTNIAEITANEIELVGVILRGILKDPDIVDDSMFETVLQMIEMVGNAGIYAHYPVTEDIRNSYMDGLSAVLNKLFHSHKVHRAITNVVKLQNQQPLSAQYQYRVSQQRRNLQSAPTSLINGVNQRQAVRQALANNGVSLYQGWGRRIDTQITTFIQKFMPKLNPILQSYTYTSNVMELLVQSKMATEFQDKTVYISEKDVVWHIPQSIFDNAQGSASERHEVNFKAMKYMASPFFFENKPGAFVETNVTELSFYDNGQNHINITISNPNEYVSIMEPFSKTQAYSSELLRCMAWNGANNSFLDDGSCSYNKMYSLVPCLTCDAGQQPNVTVSICRCKHLSRFASVYTQTLPQKGNGPLIGLYVDFNSMSYWSKSMGFYLTFGAAGLFLVGITIAALVDHYTIPKILARLIARVKRLELKGFKQKEQKKLTVYRNEKGKIVFLRHDNKHDEFGNLIFDNNSSLKKGEDVLVEDSDKVIELKKEKDENGKKFGDEDNIAESYLTPMKTKKINKSGKIQNDSNSQDNNSSMRKAFKNEEDDAASYMKKSKKRGQDQTQSNDEDSKPKNKEKLGYVNEYGEYVEAEDNEDEEGEEEEEEEDSEAVQAQKRAQHDIIEQQMQAKLEEEKEAVEFVKEHGTNSDEENAGEKSRSKEQKLYLKLEHKAKERYWFNLKSLMIHGNGLLSLLLVRSMLMPRHVRFTMLFTNILLQFFWCAVIIKNSQQALLLPDKSSTTPSDIAQSNLSVSIMAPFGTSIVMYVFAGLYKISDARINNSYTMAYLEQMLLELKKEMKMRFIIAYSITIAIYAAILWYIIQFTAAFGWRISWIWWYAGVFAVIIQYFVLDPAICFTHWIVNWCSKNLSNCWMAVRIVKMCQQEA